MPPKAQKEIIFPIQSLEQFETITSADNKKLTVIDLYANWCGPCTVMEHCFRSLFFAHEDADKRLEFFTCDSTILGEDYTAKFKKTCRPIFLIYVEGELKAEVEGADFVKIQTIVNTYIPSLDD